MTFCKYIVAIFLSNIFAVYYRTNCVFLAFLSPFDFYKTAEILKIACSLVKITSFYMPDILSKFVKIFFEHSVHT